MSGEHIVSKAGFEDDAVGLEVQAPWMNGGALTRISLASFTRKNLCRSHNERTSKLDEESRAFRLALTRAVDRAEDYKMFPRSAPRFPKFAYVDGALVERVFAKWVVNVASTHKHPIGGSDAVAGRPTDRLVRIIFGLEKFSPPEGLYGFMSPGSRLAVPHELRLEVYEYEPPGEVRAIAGALIEFRGFRFVLHLLRIPLPKSIGSRFEAWDGSSPFLVKELNFKTAGRITHGVRFQRQA